MSPRTHKKIFKFGSHQDMQIAEVGESMLLPRRIQKEQERLKQDHPEYQHLSMIGG